MSEVEGIVPVEEFNAKIRPLQCKIVNDHIVVLYAPNRYIQNEVRQKYLPIIRESLIQAGTVEGAPTVEVAVGEPPREGGAKGPKRVESAVDLGSARQDRWELDPAFTFKKFVRGKSNEVAHATALQIAEQPGSVNKPFLLYGAVGLGKTHLMQAIGNHIHDRCPTKRVVYCHGLVFLERMVKAMRERGDAVEREVAPYKSADFLLFDDIQYLGPGPATQMEFIKIFNRLCHFGRQIILTSDRNPHLIEGLESGLKDRLVMGHNVSILQPDKATAVKILAGKAAADQVDLPSEVASHIAELAGANGRQLEGALCSVIGRARAVDAPITVELARHALRDLYEVRRRRMNEERVLRIVAEHYNVEVSDLLSKRRFRIVVHARHMAMVLIRNNMQRSYMDIGRMLGGKHYTTVRSACEKISKERRTNFELDEEYTCLVRELDHMER